MIYSKIWKQVKIIARKIVKANPQTASNFKPAVIAWCVYVTVAPEQSKINVFTKGTSKGLNVFIPFGGQILPISIVGDKLAAKKAQKKATKNIISETINKIIPYLKPNWTILVWTPSKVPSRVTSLHQKNIQDKTENKPKNKVSNPPTYPWK